MTAAMADPARLIRKSVSLATNRLGSRRDAARAVVAVARAARGSAIAAESLHDTGTLPVSQWLDEVVRQAEITAGEAGVDR